MKLRFEFKQLDEALSRVRADHPQLGEHQPKIPKNIIAAILKRIQETPDANLKSLAMTLNRTERMASVLALPQAQTEELGLKVSRLLTSVPSLDHIMPAWRVIQSHVGNSLIAGALQNVARAMLEKYRSTMAPKAAKVARLLASPDLPRVLFADLTASSLTLQDWLDREERKALEFLEDSELVLQIRDLLLTEGDSSLILKHPRDQIYTWSGQLRETRYGPFAFHYLTSIPPANWDIRIIRAIVERFGLPAAAGSFWTPLLPEIRRAVQLKAAEAQLGGFFKGVHDPEGRFQFWRDYMASMTDIAYPVTKDHVFIAFGRFGLVEFRDAGNAAYFYKSSEFGWIKESISFHSRYLKKPDLCFDRLIHRQGWHNGMRDKMVLYLKGVFSLDEINRGGRR